MDNVLSGFQLALTPHAMLSCFIGVTIGTFIGVLPGIGAITAISLALPLTFYMDPLIAIITLAGIFYGSQYGSSTSAILLNVPGTPGSAVTCIDAYPMTKQGRAGVALFISAVGSFIGGSIGILLLMGLTPLLSSVALRFSSPEYFSIILFALLCSSTMVGDSPAKGLAMAGLGLLVGLAGVDVMSGQPRFTFGLPALMDGYNLVAVMMGLFGLTQVLSSFGKSDEEENYVQRKVTLRSLIPTRDDVNRSIFPVLRGSAVGAFSGILPGVGASAGTYIAYALEKRVAKDPSRLGNGAIEGVASPESANNASVQCAFIPTLGLGIPGDAVTAILIGAFVVHGITPGPLFIQNHSDMFWAIIASMWIGNVLLLVLNLPLIGIWVKVLSIPKGVLNPVIALLLCLGVYSINNSVGDVYVMVAFGCAGYMLRRHNYPLQIFALGFILAPMAELHLRRALLIADGNYAVFLWHPISAAFLVMSALMVLWSAAKILMNMRRRGVPAAALVSDD